MNSKSVIESLIGDKLIFFCFLLLASFGLMVQYSAGNHNLISLEGQILKLCLAILFYVLISNIQINEIRKISPILFGVSFFMLMLVPLIGVTINGSNRWLDLGILRFQPSEILKLSLPMFLAWYIDYKEFTLSRLDFLVLLLVMIAPAYLIYHQPDLGTSLMVLLSGFIVLFFVGVSWKKILLFLGIFLASLPIIWRLLAPYQKNRVLTFLDPTSDPLGAGYNIIQSKIAIGSGGLFGKGWMNGSQVQLDFLPEQSTDFIFAVIGEEFGLFGMLFLITLFLFILIRGFSISWDAKGTYSRMLASTITLIFFFSVFINMGMVVGLLPVVGVPLPFISQGGTSMVTIMISLGILTSISRDKKLSEE